MLEEIRLTEGQIDAAIAALNSHTDERLFSTKVARACSKLIQHLASDSIVADGKFPPPVFRLRNLDSFRKALELPAQLQAGQSTLSLYWLSTLCYCLALEIGMRQDQFSESVGSFIGFMRVHQHEFPEDAQMRIGLFESKLIVALARGEEAAAVERVKKVGDEYVSHLTGSVEKISGWEGKLEGWISRASALEANLQSQVGRLNFVGLSRAFENMRRQKRLERRGHRGALWWAGAALVVIPLISIGANVLLGQGSLKTDLSALVVAMPFFVIELIALYFFRLFVRNFYSVEAQLLQLDLRYNLCAFIQGYAEFAKEHKGEEGKLLERFETLIFSGIAADPQNIPSQFDGLEQIGKLAKEIRGK